MHGATMRPAEEGPHVSRTPRFRPIGAVVATGAVLGALALAGCGAGQVTQTSTQVPAVVGANAGVGAIVVRDAFIEFGEQPQGANIYPRGGAAPLKMSIVNTGIQPDRLVSASSPAAASVAITGDAEVPPGRVLLIEGAPAAPAPSASPSASAQPAPSAPPAPAASGVPSPPGNQIGGSGQESSREQAPAPAVQPGPSPRAGTGGAEAGGREGQVVLTGLTDNVRAGLTYPLVLNFEKAGQVTLTVPVGAPSEPREDEPAE
jgi:copper(I)-binding protein